AAHVMADAVQQLFPEAKVTIGPPVEDGFYYDFDYPNAFSVSDLEKIEAKMREIIVQGAAFECREVTRDEALATFAKRNEPYKIELINGLPEGEKITMYRHGNWEDLCRGPHTVKTADIKAFKLLKVAGAYWRGDSKNKMLQRIYGTAFASQAELDAFLQQREEAEKRDHRKLGKELGLIAFHPYAPGAAFWLPKGAIFYHELSEFMRSLLLSEGGFVEVKAPLLFNQKLWETSGHWQHYADAMFRVVSEEQNFGLKPMNCPGHMLLYSMGLHSYRDLPIRYCEQTPLHRNEASGTLAGLTRVRQFCQDDGHIFVRPDQIEEEVAAALKLVAKIYGIFDLKYEVKLSTRNPEKFIGSIETWESAEKQLAAALERNHIEYRLEPNEAAFYGPKIDFDVTDAIGRKWQCATIQLDYNLPERFDLTYIGEDSKKHRPVVIHRAIFGSFERFIAMLIEHYAGAFPTWLAPIQVQLLPISDDVIDYSQDVKAKLMQSGIRVAVDGRNEKLGLKIREAQLQKVPYMAVIGKKEKEAGGLAIRSRVKGDLGVMNIGDFGKLVLAENEQKR
ncbi:MAG: threonine--tRNA ligase, partial [Deltaproteobacteria bacterium]|nr:threonine--tRNA ligase [Deltaproteobacteria bacterium]